MTTTTYEHLFAFFGLQQNPFGASPDTRFFFSTPAHDSALAELLFAIRTRQGLMLLTGEAGAGKTTLLQQLLDTLRQLGISSSYVFHSRLDVDYLLRFILQDFGVPCASRRKGEILELLHEWLVERHTVGDSPVIIIDEAQALPIETIDELRLLLNLESADGKLVQIILSGQPELNDLLHRQELRQLRQRVMFRSKLPLLTREETSRYIESRLSRAGMHNPGLFPSDSTDAIFRYSRGIPRTINLLCEHALINAYAEQRHAIDPYGIRYIAQDFDLVDYPLSVKRDEISTGNRAVVRFPAMNSEPKSLSALRLAFLSEQLPREDTPVVPLPSSCRDAVLEEAVSFDDTHLSANKEPPVSNEIRSEELADPLEAGSVESTAQAHLSVSFAVGERLFSAESGAANEEVEGAESMPVAASEGGCAAPASRDVNPVLQYLREVAESFRRDARTFSADCARLFRGLRAKQESSAPGQNGIPV